MKLRRPIIINQLLAFRYIRVPYTVPCVLRLAPSE